MENEPESEFLFALNRINKLSGGTTVCRYNTNRIPDGVKNEYQIVFSLVYNYKYENDFMDLLIFDDEVLENHDYYMFGKNLTHSLDYAIHKLSGNVVTLDDSGDVAFRCAENCTSFIKAMTKVALLEQFYKEKKHIDPGMKLAFQENCTSLAGGEYYRDYYDLII